MKITPDDILEANPHWQQGATILPSRLPDKRRVFKEIFPWLDTQLIIALKGLRRTGKSVLLSQLKDRYIKNNNIQSTNYLFYSFDLEDQLDLLEPEAIEDVLHYYFQNILKTVPHELQQPIFIAFDEVQNVKSWQKVLKKYYDLNIPIKFIITGSASLFLKNTSDSLAGRLMEFEIKPMDFLEYSRFSNLKTPEIPNTLEERIQLPPHQITPEILKAFEEYLLCGGFPETIRLKDQGLSIAQRQAYIKKSIIHKIIGKDFRKYYNVKGSTTDYKIFELLCFEIGQPINFKKISKTTKVALETLKSHLEIFLESGLMYRVYSWNRKPRKKISAHPKYYIAAPSLAFSYLGYEQLPAGSLVGHLTESYLYQRLLELYDKEILYYRNGNSDEVDFYLQKEKIIIESKYSDYIKPDDYSFLKSSAKEYKLSPWLITKSSIVNDTDIFSQPLALF